VGAGTCLFFHTGEMMKRSQPGGDDVSLCLVALHLVDHGVVVTIGEGRAHGAGA
jgi:hypothetical protein